MSWTNELYMVYERALNTDDGKTMLPISHSTANAQIEITISDEGEAISASAVEKENAVTIIPVTEDSAARGSGINPMPLADKLVYIAGDYSQYAEGKRADNSDYFSAYMEQLGKWCKSEYSHFAITAIYAYLEKRQLISDLVKMGVIELNETNGKFSDKKYNNISQEDSFVRFIVSGKNGLCYTWLDTELHDLFRKYYESTLDSCGLSYADGKIGAVTYKHPAKIRNSGDKAKLISANDSANYTFRGRFSNKEEAIAVSYDYSQKMHNSLKWLISRQSRSYDTLTLVTWSSALGFVPSVTKSAFELFDDDAEDYDTVPKFSELLNKSLLGNKMKISPDSKVMIMGLDAATTGRLSIALYTELAESDFYNNLEKWHNGTVWRRYNSKLEKSIDDSCSLPQIANCLYGSEQSGFLACDKKLMGDVILRLLPCVTEGKMLPHDVVMILCEKASSPLLYEHESSHRKVIENTCALIKKEHTDHDNKLYYKGEIKMAYDPTCTDRSYLFGCLLAIADKAESDTYDRDERRVTNARRFWNTFSSRPYQTWKIIEERLEPYLEKEQWVMTKYTKHINEIMSKMSPEDFADNSKLSPMYLIGFHHYNALLWNSSSSDRNNEEE
ncbi:MAG: type I-C CRISPR-associated protein Cas8c/Csd1 [Ruminococcus sp.]|uniref:type I-C CRISPR-associated protein Cas8c/Csd1 n=1 Tax=Ruminococcus sp. TaxID=41978 RepID=UPI0025D33098|nr:type I-C CRISPR-associated protein Cas8c/Csd1 [Ruminococcus sp.]MCR5599645.1 type I-C CRISPR-associated protein Cas8c/Csd1 [Ruminococcus sp.]